MTALRRLTSTSALILLAVIIAAAAAAVLFTFPVDPRIWQGAAWTLLGALAGLLVLVILTGYILATDQAARTWQRIGSFLLGLACLIPLAVGLL